jgi:hypothetical protein
MTLRSGSLNLDINVSEAADSDLGSATWTYATVWGNSFSNGSGANQASKVFVDTFSLAPSATLSYDLDGALAGPLGAVTFSRIYALCLQRTDAYAATTQDENLLIGGGFILTKYLIPGADTLAAVKIAVGPRGTFVTVFPGPTGVAVTATTGDIITLTNASSADTIAGRTLILGS